MVSMDGQSSEFKGEAHLISKYAQDFFLGHCSQSACDMIKFYLPVTIVIIPDMLVTNIITNLPKSCLVVMTYQTMLAGMKVPITGTQKSHVAEMKYIYSTHSVVV